MGITYADCARGQRAWYAQSAAVAGAANGGGRPRNQLSPVGAAKKDASNGETAPINRRRFLGVDVGVYALGQSGRSSGLISYTCNSHVRATTTTAICLGNDAATHRR